MQDEGDITLSAQEIKQEKYRWFRWHLLCMRESLTCIRLSMGEGPWTEHMDEIERQLDMVKRQIGEHRRRHEGIRFVDTPLAGKVHKRAPK